jgi:8-amino-7-oxononanoate synthase
MTSKIQTSKWLDSFKEELATIDSKNLLRKITTIESIDGSRVKIHGKWFVCWCNNDYLGLSQHPKVISDAFAAAKKWGIGARASRLLGGSSEVHLALERDLASFFGFEDCVVFASGYLANLGAISSIVGEGDLVLADRLAHASLIDACRMSGSTFRVFAHNDIPQLKALLNRYTSFRRRLIVTEGVFSMDGDKSPVGELLRIAKLHQAYLYLDDAHGAFVNGPSGRGSIDSLASVKNAPLIYMATLGKALGSQGAFVAGPKALIEFLRNRARTFIYSTALAITSAAAASSALRLLRQDKSIRKNLHKNVTLLHSQLQGIKYPKQAALRDFKPSHIMPIIIGSSEDAVSVASGLWKRQIFSPAIRPPTVPKGSARLRISVSSLHTTSQIEALAQALKNLLKQT